MHGRRPVIYYSNGYQTWLWDDALYPPRPMQGFAGRDELHLMVRRRASRKPLAGATLNRAIVERYYQEEGIRRVLERFETEHGRGALSTR